MTRRRFTTRREDAQFILARIHDATRDWAVGDRCQTFKGTHTATVVRIDGDAIFLSDGTSGHRSRMRRPLEA